MNLYLTKTENARLSMYFKYKQGIFKNMTQFEISYEQKNGNRKRHPVKTIAWQKWSIFSYQFVVLHKQVI